MIDDLHEFDYLEPVDPEIAALPDLTDYGYSLRKVLGGSPTQGRCTYLAEQLESRQLCVVKMVYFHVAGWDEIRVVSEREYKTLARVSHHFVPEVIELLTPKNECWVALVQQHINALALSEFSLEAKELFGVALNVLDVLKEAQRKKIAHLDIKPENILVDDYGNGYLVDFGVARSIHDAGATGATTMLGGTPGFTDPEVFFAGDNPSFTSDLFSLGATLLARLLGLSSAEFSKQFGRKLMGNEPLEVTKPLSVPDEAWSWLLSLLKRGEGTQPVNAVEAHKSLAAIFRDWDTLQAGSLSNPVNQPGHATTTSKAHANTRRGPANLVALVFAMATGAVAIGSAFLGGYHAQSTSLVPFETEGSFTRGNTLVLEADPSFHRALTAGGDNSWNVHELPNFLLSYEDEFEKGLEAIEGVHSIDVDPESATIVITRSDEAVEWESITQAVNEYFRTYAKLYENTELLPLYRNFSCYPGCSSLDDSTDKVSLYVNFGNPPGELFVWDGLKVDERELIDLHIELLELGATVDVDIDNSHTIISIDKRTISEPWPVYLEKIDAVLEEFRQSQGISQER